MRSLARAEGIVRALDSTLAIGVREASERNDGGKNNFDHALRTEAPEFEEL